MINVIDDTFGVDTNFIVFDRDNKTVVNFYSSYLNSYDLKLFLED